MLEIDQLSIQIKLTESERVLAIKRSNTSGGDGIGVYISVLHGAVFDIGKNFNRITAKKSL